MKDDNIYQLTDGCMWERAKEEGTEGPHSVEVVNVKTGQVRYILGGSKIKFVEGDISDIRTQLAYNEQSNNLHSL